MKTKDVESVILRGRKFFIESLILTQDERWRRALGMQVERTLSVGQGKTQNIKESKSKAGQNKKLKKKNF